MNDLEPAILEQYRRVYESYNEVTQFPRPCLSVGDVLRAHFMIANHFYLEGEGIGGIGPKDINALESTVCRQISGYGGRSKWNGLTCSPDCYQSEVESGYFMMVV